MLDACSSVDEAAAALFLSPGKALRKHSLEEEEAAGFSKRVVGVLCRIYSSPYSIDIYMSLVDLIPVTSS